MSDKVDITNSQPHPSYTGLKIPGFSYSARQRAAQVAEAEELTERSVKMMEDEKVKRLLGKQIKKEITLMLDNLLVLANEISAKNQSWPKRVYVEMTAPARYLKAAKEAEEFIENATKTAALELIRNGHVIFPAEFTTATGDDETDSVLSEEEDAEARRKREAFDKAFNELTSPGGVNMLIRRSGSVESFQTVIGQSEKIGEGLVPNHLETDSDKEHWHVNLYAEKTS